MSAAVDREKREFIDDQIFGMTLGAATQRGDVYEAGKTEAERATVHTALRDALEAIAPAYRSPVDPDEHCANIERLAEQVGKRCGSLLRGGKLRIGTAQKALNLYLKYLWCLERCAEPPHCPFDARVLQHIPGWRGESWTKIDSPERYLKLVADARTAADAKGESLAVWELRLYNSMLAR